jgi:hypothetical protein
VRKGLTPFDGTKDGSMDHDRRVVGIIEALELESKAKRELKVELNRGALERDNKHMRPLARTQDKMKEETTYLMLALERVGDFDVDLWAVESAVSLLDGPCVPEPRERLFQCILGLVAFDA